MSDAGPARILELAPDQLTPEQKAGIEAVIGGRGRLLTPYKIWLHSPTLMRALETLGTFLNKACSLSEREVELCIVLTAHHWHGAYVYTVHARRLNELGVSDAAIRAIEQGKEPDFGDARERAIYDLAEVLALFGYYSAVAIAMKLHRVPVPN
jgi:4-carboxymuconolactone decarboxylase